MTDTLAEAIDWMDRALRETRETLAAVDPDKRYEARRNAALYLAAKAEIAGAAVWLRRPKFVSGVDWHDVEIAASAAGLTIFDMWLAAARVKAGAE